MPSRRGRYQSGTARWTQLFFDRDHIVRWAWNTYRSTTERVQQLSVRRPELTIVRFRSHRDVDAWIAHQLIPVTR
ncbi:hypothetical protein CH259_06270 [Rhodococcus sp. 05-2254-4]|nr:hypothetical protein CH259_06270 [Rhodococcus sp. 05-2254-4]OZE43001.1 hypothetical protein CH261_19550 [Rhodococcus sp. 05-2254-3]